MLGRFLWGAVGLLPLVAMGQDVVREDVHGAEDRQITYDFMGFELGRPMRLRECPSEKIPYAGAVYRLSSADFPCWVAPGMRPGTGSKSAGLLNVMQSESKRPPGTKEVFLRLVDGQVEGVTVGTDGFVHQQALMDALVRKFGAPSETATEGVSTGVGAQLRRISALWLKPNLRVQFWGIGERIDEGSISVYTTRGYEEFRAKAPVSPREF